MSEGARPASGAPREPAADRLERLWRQGNPPDPFAFLADVDPCPPAKAAELLALDQWLRWQAGIRTPAEDYLVRRPDLAADSELAVQLIYGEFLVREAIGDRPERDEYLRRFPLFADRLRDQFELHQALTTGAGEPPAAADAVASSTLDGAPPLFPTFIPVLEPVTPRYREAGTPDRSESSVANVSAFEIASGASALRPRLGRYRIIQPLGSGGMGSVYLAEDEQLGRRVALKVPRIQEGANPELVARFYREARIAAHLDHPNLCPVYDVGQEGGIHFLTMPVLKGEPLSALLKRKGALAPRTAARITHRIALAMQVAHEAGIIHRDLKPANVMVGRRGEPVVMDFGLARRELIQDAGLTQPGMLLGTPLYTPPEQVWGCADLAGPAWDIYSLGVILYEMLTGSVPFRRDSVQEVFRQILTCEPEPPSRFCPDLDPRLESVCLTAMQKDPHARFPSMAAFAEALEGVLRAPDTGRSRSRGRAMATDASGHRKRRVLRLGAALLGLSLALVVGSLAWRASHRPPTIAARAQPPDRLQPETRWAGSAHLIPYGRTVDVLLWIKQRRANQFRGVYETEHGTFAWEIEGSIENGVIRWRYTKLLRETYPVGLVGIATVEGRYEGDRIDASYRDADSSARLEFRLQSGSAPGPSGG